MKYALGNMLNGAGGLNADQLALDLQFAADKTLTARRGPTPILTRGSTATFVGSNGLIQTAAVNAARFDHDPVTLASRGLLIEEGRTNLSLYSGEIVIGAGWGASATTSIVDGLGPDENNAYRIAETTATASHNLGNSGGTTASSATSVVLGTVYTGSIFIKKVSGSVDWIQVTLGSGGFGTVQYANFNIGNGTVGNSAGLASGTSPRIENYGNGWYRLSISATATATTATNNVVLGFIQNTNGTTRLPSYAGSTSNSILASLCQFEAGSFATSYIPTTTSALARSADVCSITGAGFTGMWNALEGSLFTSAIFNAPVGSSIDQIAVDVNDATTANRLRYFRNVNNSFPRMLNTSNSTTDVDIVGVLALSSFVTQKFSTGFNSNDYVLYVNNAQIGTDNLATLPISPTTFTIGTSGVGVTPIIPLNGTIASIRYYKKRLSNQKLQALTV